MNNFIPDKEEMENFRNQHEELMERFQESMQLFAYTFNLPAILEVPHLNAFKPDQDISEECLKLIRKENKYDCVHSANMDKTFMNY